MDTKRRGPKRTSKQEADLQRHLRHQSGSRSKEESLAASATKSMAKGCGTVVVGMLGLLVGAVILLFTFLMKISG